ncbi:hypothetical protein FPQ18DRAFT_396251 [Pyronema domesticum]|uniref:Uncharacterized protein n=1 Tax=Pyronema omphalodes (strain CBS 100304) TaxID=1076935 RepID=U4LD67_PYROM|nr:hypothetical protein FPQ18DRAFT_396251 [Pyronema domesticum]CCX30064.1 Similar to hypothetical protein MPER_07254 [Moniliophthora perniciosa FA553]; acc. no. XP_002393083 [Pyronema omphalodes CBS 100304]
MQLLTLLPLFASLALGAPAVSETLSSITSATLGGVRYCNNVGYKGPCEGGVYSRNLCYDVTPEFNDRISAFSVDQGTSCTVYQDYRCKGNKRTIGFPGNGDLRNIGFNDIISSFICTW